MTHRASALTRKQIDVFLRYPLPNSGKVTINDQVLRPCMEDLSPFILHKAASFSMRETITGEINLKKQFVKTQILELLTELLGPQIYFGQATIGKDTESSLVTSQACYMEIYLGHNENPFSVLWIFCFFPVQYK